MLLIHVRKYHREYVVAYCNTACMYKGMGSAIQHKPEDMTSLATLYRSSLFGLQKHGMCVGDVRFCRGASPSSCNFMHFCCTPIAILPSSSIQLVRVDYIYRSCTCIATSRPRIFQQLYIIFIGTLWPCPKVQYQLQQLLAFGNGRGEVSHGEVAKLKTM